MILFFLLTVMSDQATSMVRIRNATVVVHYDFPNKKEFGNRLLCLLQNIQENVIFFCFKFFLNFYDSNFN